MKLTRNTNDRNIIINTEQDFQTDLGWQENLTQFEDEVLKDIINPVENYETVRFIHKPYSGSTLPNNLTHTDIWFQFYFLSGSTYVQNYETIGITNRENEMMLRQSTESFFRLEFFKTPLISGDTYEGPTRKNRRLVFTKNLSLPVGEKFFYTTTNSGYYIHIPVFMGSNYKNKENMYLFWFEDETVLEETELIGTDTSNTFFMTAKFYNAKDGSILDFTNRVLTTGTTIDEKNDMYYQVDFDLTGKTYEIFKYTGGTKGSKVGTSGLGNSINFYENGGGTISTQPTIAPTSIPTITPTPLPTHTPYPTIEPTPTPTPIPEVNEASYYLSLERCGDGAVVWSNAVNGAPDDPDFDYNIGTFVYDQNNVYYEVIDFQYFSYNPDLLTSIQIQGTAVGCPTPTPTPTPTATLDPLLPTPTPTSTSVAPSPATATPTPLPPTATPTPTPTPIPFAFTVTTGCTNYEGTGTLSVNITAGGSGSGWYWKIISGPAGYPTGNQINGATVSNLSDGDYAILLSDDAGYQASTNADYTIDCPPPPDVELVVGFIASSLQPTLSQCNSATQITINTLSPTGTFCNFSSITSTTFTSYGQGNNYWLCYQGQYRRIYLAGNGNDDGYPAGNCGTLS